MNLEKLERDFEKIKLVLRSEAVKYLNSPNINSVGIGYRIKNGKKTDEIVIQFTVDQKIKLEALGKLDDEKGELIPKFFEYEDEKGKKTEIRTDVIQRRYEPSYKIVERIESNSRKTRHEVISPGISIGNINSLGAGTLGCIVYENSTGNPCILSNWHVLEGDKGKIGDDIIQPGFFDDNSDVEENVVGKLVRSNLGLSGDCAIASINNRVFSDKIHDIAITPKRLAEVELGDKVIKSGRTTGVTHGIVSRIEVTVKLNYGGETGARNIGCFDISPDPNFPAENGEISMAGDSGSIWLIKDRDSNETTDIIAGLHFAGESSSSDSEFALACNITSVFKKLNISLKQESRTENRFRKGYDPGFLGEFEVPHPKLKDSINNDALEVDGKKIIDYVHFSIVMSREHKFAIYTAHNIDGNAMKSVSKKRWKYDNRFSSDFQTGNDLYVDNPWDKGHLVRRIAVAWGSLEEARAANSDTFYYTNAAPQHENFNQDEWSELENWILDKAKEDEYKLCVFTGPIYSDSSLEYRGSIIPSAYFKVIAVRKAEDDQLSVTAFLMSQSDYILKDKAGSNEFFKLHVYQVPIDTIEGLTGLDFGSLKEAQPISISERAIVGEKTQDPTPTIISQPEDIRL
ncbi:DNA/RNA non-specific endonuclease [Wukongibacter baidiensis]